MVTFIKNLVKKMKIQREITRFVLVFLVLSLISSSFVISTGEQDIEWEVKIDFLIEYETGQSGDECFFGESVNATNGPPADSFDALKSPTPPSPYVYSYFDDGLSIPYTQLSKDYRTYCDGNEKQWNLTIQWDLISYPEDINLSWDESFLSDCPYNNLFLREESGKILLDMRSEDSFTFSVNSWDIKKFLITAENVSCDDTIGDDDDDEPISDDDDDNNDDAVDPDPGDDDDSGSTTENQAPIAIIQVNNQTGLVGSLFVFSAQQSTDDGIIQSYEWDLGNGLEKSGVNVTGVYQSEGEYTVVLTVTDELGVSSTDTITIMVQRGNLPPLVGITGPDNGRINTTYEFTFTAIDAHENETFRFGIDWGDMSEKVTTDFSTQDVIQLNHSWSYYGKYNITIYSENVDANRSSLNYYVFPVDVLIVNDEISGYLYDEDSDGIYDGIYLDEGNRNIDVIHIDDQTYSFQDAQTRYTINSASSLVTTEQIQSNNNDSDQSSRSFDGILIAIAIILILIVGIFIFIIKYT